MLLDGGGLSCELCVTVLSEVGPSSKIASNDCLQCGCPPGGLVLVCPGLRVRSQSFDSGVLDLQIKL